MAAKRTKFAKFAGIFPLRRAKRIASVMCWRNLPRQTTRLNKP
jgi:hypothetical protein